MVASHFLAKLQLCSSCRCGFAPSGCEGCNRHRPSRSTVGIPRVSAAPAATWDSGMKQHLPEDVPCLKQILFFHKSPPVHRRKWEHHQQLFEVAEEGACATQSGSTATDCKSEGLKKGDNRPAWLLGTSQLHQGFIPGLKR